MAYDILPKPLSEPLSEVISILEAKQQDIGVEKLDDLSDVEAWDSYLEQVIASIKGDIRWFLIACRRSSLVPSVIIKALKEAQTEGKVTHIKSMVERFQVAFYLLKEKTESSGCSVAGLKAIASPEVTAGILHNCHFLFLMRDPRDVYASHARLSWDKSAKTVATIWNERMDRYHKMKNSGRFNIHKVSFEGLIMEPETEIQEICDFLDIPFDNLGENFTENAEVYGVPKAFNPNLQLFWSEGLSKSKVGAWKGIITKTDQQLIEQMCGSYMKEEGYF